jgi:hypothetical protein
LDKIGPKTALDVDATNLDAGEKTFIDNVRTHGWAATHVVEDNEGVGFSYTTGFWHKFRAPELVLFSLPIEVAHQILWNFFNNLEKGQRFSDNVPVSEVLEGYDVVLRTVAKERYPDFLGWNRWFYGGDHFQAQQLFFPDKSGQFPWDASVSSNFVASQPDLSNSDKWQ